MIIVDTNVVSELLRPEPEPRVERWLSQQDGQSVYLTAISEASFVMAWPSCLRGSGAPP